MQDPALKLVRPGSIRARRRQKASRRHAAPPLPARTAGPYAYAIWYIRRFSSIVADLNVIFSSKQVNLAELGPGDDLTSGGPPAGSKPARAVSLQWGYKSSFATFLALERYFKPLRRAIVM